jgi:hypothetical protein
MDNWQGERCRHCGLKTLGTDTCEHCHAHIEGDPSSFGCRYLGNNAWDCGWIDGEENIDGDPGYLTQQKGE